MMKCENSVFKNREKVKEIGSFSVFRKNEENGIFSFSKNRENGRNFLSTKNGKRL